MKVLIVGGGGREHALAWAVAKSPKLTKLYAAPGNAGIAACAECLDIGAEDLDGICAAVKDLGIEFVIVGPEAPLVAGLADRIDAMGIPVFGPSAAAAEIEGSKGMMKDLLAKYGIPTADYERFDEPDAAKEYIRIKNHPVVVKADGLAAGKGVILSHTINEAYAAVDQIMIEEAFGDAGAEIVIEEFLTGEEASFFALCDGTRAIPLAGAQDHKQVHDGDHGPNTGGMGAYTPAPVLDEAMEKRIMDEIVTPTVEGMAKEGKPYKGVLFAGLMIGEDGPKVIEFNCRFGDPECQPIMSRLKSDALEMLLAAAKGELDKIKLKWDPRAALTVVMAANGYPGKYAKGTEIRGLDDADAMDDVTVFHAGTKTDGNGRMLANGGRVLGVTALGNTVEDAQKRAYDAVDAIDWPEGFCRRDIGWRAVGR
ncbi:MAG: phosphoribosylamine--glycine ligase [Rhodospirillales bacterium]|nr:phosphoribosylamine--glycine ligase [Rhodospirillales bacterium]MBO6788558.1 phosphoribosylamine--glycine ligase [Rhodospirillales bacterium]